MIPIKLPPGMEIMGEDGVLRDHVICQRGQYGMPSASFYWTRELNAWMLQTFNSSTFRIVQMVLEPCMYMITNLKTGSVTHMLVHVDDIDLITDSDDDVAIIFDLIDRKFGLVAGDPDVLLGVHRKLTEVDGVRYLEFLMTDYASEMFNKWKAKLSTLGTPMNEKYTPEIPFPTDTVLSVVGSEKFPLPSSADTDATIKMYREIVGELLWLARMAMPKLLLSVSMESRVVSIAGKAHFDLCLQTLQYAYGHRHEGIRFRSDGCNQLLAAYDSADNPDPKDGKSQFGYSIMLFDGPIDAVSKKTPRVGTSSTHNEYIAMAECARRLRYFQDLLTEMDLKQYVGRTPMEGDNWPATTQLHDRRITDRNRHYLSEFFWLYEMYADQKFTPCWVSTLSNGPDIYTKGTSRQIMDHLGPLETGYHHRPRAWPDLDMTPAKFESLGRPARL